MQGIVASVESASALIRQLLAYGRRQPARPEVVSLNRIVEAWRDTLAQTLGEGIRLELRLFEGLWNVRMDPVQIEQVLVNLVVNGREAMPLGGTLVLSTENASFSEGGPGRPVSAPGAYVVLKVTDSGPGIPPAVLGRIFEPFFTTKEALGHSGLGLATVYGIVKQNHGNVWAANAPAGGTEFSVYLPRTLDRESAPAVASDAASPGGHEHILLIEDNPAVRETTAALLESAGYRVSQAADGEEALAALGDAGGVDLLISDVVMPGLRGAEVVARARARHRHLPALFLSASVEDRDSPGLSAGAELLAKPYSPEMLFAAVRRALARHGMPAPPEPG
jgi:CheY-like chemotaxis protein